MAANDTVEFVNSTQQYNTDRYNTREETERSLQDPPTQGEIEYAEKLKEQYPELKDDPSLWESIKGFNQFIKDVKNDGLFHTIYGKTIPEFIGDSLKTTGEVIGKFILANGDVFFLMPAFLFLAGTFFVGSNKFSKWIIPLGLAYFASRVMHQAFN